MNNDVKIIDVETNTITFRDYTPEEIEQRKIELEKFNLIKAEKDAEQKVKDDAKAAILTKLGLTADEVAALLG